MKAESKNYKQNEIEEAVKTFSGTPGFLSYYGLMRTKDRMHKRAYEETLEFAASEWKKDINAFLKIYNSRNYIKALKASASTVSGVTASELEGELKVARSTAYRLIENLVDVGMFVADENGQKFSVIDPPLKKAVQSF